MLVITPTWASAQSIQQFLYEGAPEFHGAKVIGNYPNTELIFTVPATGERPITFSAENLPTGLTLDPVTGIIQGYVMDTGEYKTKITAANAKGKTEEELKILIGDKLCLTPPMGWNSWNVFTKNIDETMLMEIADAMVNSGMRDVGYQYINIDDFWHAASRDSSGRPVADPKKFPRGIKYLADYIHAKGLKLGIYSDAGTLTCGKCFGGYGYEEIDAKTYAEWGVDLLKYDFCHVPLKKKEAITRYTKMGNALKSSGRSIVYSICNWGLFAPWKWAPATGGHYWRTTPDIFDTWKGGNPFMMSVMKIIRRQNRILQYGKPGQWNDPDMLIVGNYGKGNATSWKGKFKGMSDLEYQSHMSLWAMMNAPLLASCDLRKMNLPTRNILLNADLLAINQDEWLMSTYVTKSGKDLWIYRKRLSNGSIATAIFNPNDEKIEKTFGRAELTGLQTCIPDQVTPLSIYDVWQHKVTGELIWETIITLQPHETKVLLMRLAEKKDK